MESQIEQLASSASKPHAVVIPWPAQGHISPMMNLSNKLARKGFVVTFVNSEYNHLRMVHDNKKSSEASTEDASDIRLVCIPDGLPPNHPRTGQNLDLFEATTKMGIVFEELLVRLLMEEPKVTCIIFDIFVPFTREIATKFKIPQVAFYPQSAASFAVHVMVREGFCPSWTETQTNSDSFTHDKSSSIVSNLIACIPGALKSQTTEWMISFLESYDPSDFLFDYMILPFKRLDDSPSVILNTFEELEQITLEAIRNLQETTFFTVGPLLPSDFFTDSLATTEIQLNILREDYGCLEWLKTQAPTSVLYISFGSIVGLSARGIEELALGLEATEQPILWVVRPDFMLGESAEFPEGFMERMRSRSCFVSWAPQRQVLSDPAVGGFLTHCGWNSTLESVSSGVPMLGWPIRADQKLDCRCVVDGWEVGLRMEPDKEGVVRREEVEGKVRMVMQGKEGRGMRERLRDGARGACGEGGSSTNDFNNLVRHLKTLGC